MELIRFQEQHVSLIDAYMLSEEQLRFTAHPSKSIPLCKAEPNRHAVLGIDNDRLVVYFALHEQEGVQPYSENPRAILLRTLSTDIMNSEKVTERLRCSSFQNLFNINFRT